jgi:hypothetical protein
MFSFLSTRCSLWFTPLGLKALDYLNKRWLKYLGANLDDVSGRIGILLEAPPQSVTPQAQQQLPRQNLLDRLRGKDRTQAITNCEPARASLNLTLLARSVETRQAV